MKRTLVVAAMIAAAAVFTLALWSCSSDKKPPEPRGDRPAERVARTFTGKVIEVVYLGDYSGKAIVIGGDPRWVVTLELPADGKEEAKRLVYAIHSPTKLFAMPGEEAIGRTFDFTEYAQEIAGKDGKVIWRRLEASERAAESKERPAELAMTQIWISDAGEPRQYVFVIDGYIAFKTVDGLEKFLKDVRRGTKLTWSPGCCRNGDEPLLSSPEEMKKFKDFCDGCGIKFILEPAG